MSKPKEKRRPGLVDDRVSYTIDDLKTLGIGEETQDEMRAGGVGARLISGKLRFLGDEINAWIRRQPAKKLLKQKSVA
jgi:hypothetical protein